MIWMLCENGTIRHIKEMIDDQSEVTDAYPKAVCGAQLSRERTDYLSNMMLPALGFRKCKHCLKWEANREHSR